MYYMYVSMYIQSIGDCSRLKTLDVSSNHIQVFPSEVVGYQYVVVLILTPHVDTRTEID